MSRFTTIITNLRTERAALLEASRRRRAARSTKPKQPAKKLTFTSPELEKIFNSLPPEMREHAMKGGQS